MKTNSQRPKIDSKLAAMLGVLHDGKLPYTVRIENVPLYATLICGDNRATSRRKIREALERLKIGIE